MWETQEWQLPGPTTSNNPFDVQAAVVFTHQDSGDTITTGMFYDGFEGWRFRFTPPRTGEWAFLSRSEFPELDGIEGSLHAVDNPNPAARGLLESQQGFWRWSHTKTPANVHYLSYSSVDRFHDQPERLDRDIQVFLRDHGFGGFRLPALDMGWFDLTASSQGTDTLAYHGELNPDPATFEALERLISSTYRAGGSVHLQLWSDDGTSPLPWRVDDPAAHRLQRYLAARLGPLPGWMLSHGQHRPDNIQARETLGYWLDGLRQQLGWPHLLMDATGTDGFVAVQTPLPDYQALLALRGEYPQQPLMVGNALTLPFPGQGGDEVYGLELTRRGLWRTTLAGGIGAAWGNFLNGDQSLASGEGSAPYPDPHILQTYRRFFFDGSRLRTTMVPDDSLSDGASVLRTPDWRLIFYQEDTSEIHLQLDELPDSLPVIAVDTRQPYAEINLGLVSPGDQIWSAPYSSDWALAIGEFTANDEPTPSAPTSSEALAAESPRLTKATTTSSSDVAITLGTPTASSGREYRWINGPGIAIGVLQYTDRDYHFEGVPTELQGLPFLQTPNNDKRSTGESFLSFSVDQDARVLVAHDNRYATRPDWLARFTDTGMTLSSPAGSFSVFARDVGAGTITLGGNSPDGEANNSMYSVIIQQPDSQPGGNNNTTGDDTSYSPITDGESPTPGDPVVASGERYRWIADPGLSVGAIQYIDRGYVFESVPDALLGLTYLQTANNDKRSTDSAFLSFSVSQNTRVYVAHDDRYTIRPTWLEGFIDTGLDLGAEGVTFSVLSRDFTAGTVTLGGNSPAGQSDHSMYSVILQSLGGGDTGGDTDSGGELVAPAISEPPRDQTVTEGSALSFSVTATGTDPLSYQWYRNGTAIADATASSFSLNTVGLDDAGDYVVTVSNAAGEVSSAPATLTVNADTGDDGGGTRPRVEQWKQFRVSYSNSSWSGNPFDLDCTATFTHQDSGRQLRQFCFYAGANTWKIYFMPDATGTWRYTTSSPDADLNGHSGAFDAVASSLGGVMTEAGNRWQLSDGTPIMPILLATRQYLKGNPLSTLQPFLEWSHDTVGATLIGTTLVYFNHGQAFEPYEESAEGERFYLPLWDRMNDSYDYLRDQGMGHYIMFYSDDGENPSSHGIPEGSGGNIGRAEERLFRYTVARFGAYPMVVWDSGIDIGEYRSTTWIDNFARWFRENDPWQHPVSSRSGGGSGGKQPTLANYWSDGTSTLPTRSTAVSTWSSRQLPSIYTDRWRENYRRGSFDRNQIRRAVWEMGLTGGTGVYIGGSNNGGYLDSAYASDLESAADIGHASRFFHQQVFGFQRLQPADRLVVSGSSVVNALAADPGREYVAYLDSGGSFTLDLGQANGSLEGRWYNPLSGESNAIATIRNPSSEQAFSAPSGGDWVLHLWSSDLQ